MSFHHLDRYAGVPSPLTDLPPAARVLGVVVVALGAALLPLGAWGPMILLLLLVLTLAAVARMRPAALLTRLLPPLGFVLLVSGGVLFLAPGAPVAALGPFAITDAGLLRFASTLGRALPALAAAVLLVSTTRFTEVVEALRELRLPVAVTGSIGLAYRFLYLLVDEWERVRRAAASRNAGTTARARRRLAMAVLGATAGRTLERSERLHRSMVARGYDGAMPALRPHPLDRAALARVGGLALVVACIVAWGWL